MDHRTAHGDEATAPSAPNSHQQRVDKAFEFQGAMSVALTTMKRIAVEGNMFEEQPRMTPKQRLDAITEYCDRMLAKLPADYRDWSAKV